MGRKGYPCVETIQKNHICHKVIAPARYSDEIKEKAQNLAQDCVRSIDGVGVFGIEMFLTEDDELLVNEIAPRPHNTDIIQSKHVIPLNLKMALEQF